MNLQTPLSGVPGIGPNFVWKLKQLNLETVNDLITHFPFRYDDFSNASNVLEAKEGERVTLIGEIWSIKNVFTRSRKVLTQAVFNDGTGPIEITWFNQSWLTKQINVGDRIQISGKISKYKNKYSIVSPVWEKALSLDSGGAKASQNDNNRSDNLHTGRLVPVYPETFGLTSKWIRAKIAQILPQVKDQIEDPMPDDIRKGMKTLPDAIEQIHFPDNYQEAIAAKERLGFDELFFISLATLKTRADWHKKPIIDKFQISNFQSQISNFYENLPFKLTNAQMKVVGEILRDLEKEQPMNRLVQGEVGSGKTVVAAVACFVAHLNGYKTLFMAPTEILAIQHHTTLIKLLEPFGIKIGLYTGSRKFTKARSDKQKVISKIIEPDVIVGTHALLSEKLLPENVGLIIVDEQQRFGVGQRTLLRSKAKVPHFLTMTATPIPRTVALTLYGDLDLSIIDELPKGRMPIKTYVVPNKKRDDAYKFIADQIKAGDQIYIITPLIELSESLTSAKAAKVEFEKLKREVFPDFRIGLLHGRLKPQEKNQVLADFRDHNLDILVSTSMVEVGVDVPNATIMVIEGAERFGLAQLHQLRGRIGRGQKASFCFLFLTDENSQDKSRLKNLETISNGLLLAELDLKIRGSGQIFGTAQSGRFELKVASLSDLTLVEKTREAAKEILNIDPNLANYPKLRVKLADLAANVMPD